MRLHHVVLTIAAMLLASTQAAPAAHQNQVGGALDNRQASHRFLRVDKTADDEERAGEKVYHLSKSEKTVAFVKDIVPLFLRRADANTAYKALKVQGTGTEKSAILTWYLKLKAKTALKHTPNGKYITM